MWIFEVAPDRPGLGERLSGCRRQGVEGATHCLPDFASPPLGLHDRRGTALVAFGTRSAVYGLERCSG
jgi:hypothetical protein